MLYILQADTNGSCAFHCLGTSIYTRKSQDVSGTSFQEDLPLFTRSMDWFQGQSTGNHGHSQISRFFLQIFPQTDVIQTDGFLLLPLAKRLRSLPAASHGGMAELQIPIEVGTLPAMDVQMCPDLSSVYHPKIILFGPLRSYQVLSGSIIFCL